jgi:hypothetical protein
MLATYTSQVSVNGVKRAVIIAARRLATRNALNLQVLAFRNLDIILNRQLNKQVIIGREGCSSWPRSCQEWNQLVSMVMYPLSRKHESNAVLPRLPKIHLHSSGAPSPSLTRNGYTLPGQMLGRFSLEPMSFLAPPRLSMSFILTCRSKLENL